MSVELDSTDVQILEMLQSEGRIMYKDIAAKTRLSLPTVRARIERLREWGIIKKFTIVLDPNKIAGLVRAYFLVEVDPPQVEEVTAKLSAIKEVREIHQVAGSYSLVLKMEARSIQELGDLNTKRVADVDGITKCTCLTITKSPKEEYGVTVEPNTAVQFKCDYCHSTILGRPYVAYIGGGRYYFNSEKCAEAYQSTRTRKEGPHLVLKTGEKVELVLAAGQQKNTSQTAKSSEDA